MLGLALDSAGQTASVALWRRLDVSVDGQDSGAFQILASEALPAASGRADQLILLVEQLLDRAALTYADLDVIAVNRGPGSFTGIRSAVALSRGLALATGCLAIGVSSHEAIAVSIGMDNANRKRRLMIAKDARRGEVYLQLFENDVTPLGDVAAMAPDQAAIALSDGCWLLAGSGAHLVEPHLDDGHDVVAADAVSLDAGAVAMAAHRRLSAGETPIRGFDLLPLYVRAPDAVRPTPLVPPPTGNAAIEERL